MLEASREPSEERFIAIAAAAQLTGKDRTTIFRARKSGRLPVWINEARVEAVRVADLARLYPASAWPDLGAEGLGKFALAGRFSPSEAEGARILAWRGPRQEAAKGEADSDPELIAAAVRQAADRLAFEKAAGWRVLAWAGAVAMLMIALSNFLVVASLARLAGLF